MSRFGLVAHRVRFGPMQREELLRRLDAERRTIARGDEVLDVTAAVTRIVSPYCAIAYSSLDEADADAAIFAEIARHRDRGADFEWNYAHDRPADMLGRLERHGFRIGPREAVLVLDLSENPGWIAATDTRAIVRIDRPEHVDAYRQVAETVFSKNYDLTAGELTRALRSGSPHVRGYVAFVEHEPASIGRLYTHPASIFGGLYGGGTLPRFRGRGLYRAIVAARARDAIAAGVRYLIVDALPTSHPILRRLGFQWLTDTWPCHWRPDPLTL